MNRLEQLKQWVMQSHNPLAGTMRKSFNMVKSIEVPAFSIVYVPIRVVYTLLKNGLSNISRILFWTPIFKTQLSRVGRHLKLIGGLPLVQGNLSIKLGDDCCISGKTTFLGRESGTTKPQLIIGNHVDIARHTTIAVGMKVILGNHVKIADKALLAGYPGDLCDANLGKQGIGVLDNLVGDIILEDGVHLAAGVTVMQGVTIGKGTLVAAGSVVTHNLPSNVIAAGVPAITISRIKSNQSEASGIKDNNDANKASQKVTSILAGGKK